MDDADSISAQIAQVERSKTEREEQNAQREQASMSKHALAFASQIRLQQLPRAHLENLPTADIEQLARIVKKLERRLANDCESNDSALSRIRELLKTKNYSHNERLSERLEHLGFSIIAIKRVLFLLIKLLESGASDCKRELRIWSSGSRFKHNVAMLPSSGYRQSRLRRNWCTRWSPSSSKGQHPKRRQPKSRRLTASQAAQS